MTCRFTHLTNGFSKKVENHAYAVALHMMYYNFVRVHSKPRMSPAMASGVSDSLWEIGDIDALMEVEEAELMSNHIDKSWVVFASIENFEHDRCVDLFFRPDKTYGFEEFRRDPEDRGEWTPVQFYSGLVYRSSKEALSAAERSVSWLAEILIANPHLRKSHSIDSN